MKKALAALALLVVGGAVGVGATYLVLDDEDDGGNGTAVSTAPDDSTDDGTEAEGGACDYGDTSGCVAGAEIVLNDGEWTCDQPLARYAESLGGELPLKVTARFTRPVETVAGIVDLTSGCTGRRERRDRPHPRHPGRRAHRRRDRRRAHREDRGDGHRHHRLDRLRPARSRRPPGRHPGPRRERHRLRRPRGRRLGRAALDLHGSLGRASTSPSAAPPDSHRRTTRCIRCRVVACRRAINVGESVSTRVTNGRFRSGNPEEREEELATGEIGLCAFGVSTCNVDTTAQDDVFEGNVCDKFPYGTGRR